MENLNPMEKKTGILRYKEARRRVFTQLFFPLKKHNSAVRFYKYEKELCNLKLIGSTRIEHVYSGTPIIHFQIVSQVSKI